MWKAIFFYGEYFLRMIWRGAHIGMGNLVKLFVYALIVSIFG